MLLLPGSSVFSVAKRESLLEQVQAVCPKVSSLDAIWIHLVKPIDDISEAKLSAPSSEESGILTRLLDYGYNDKLAGTDSAFQRGENIIYVTPRAGSISPWSSKATDIAHLCHLGSYVERIERGIAFIFEASNFVQSDLNSFSHLIHDRMTQAVSLTPPHENILFSHHSPRPLRQIGIKASNREEAIQKLSKANQELGLALAADEINYLVDAYVTSESCVDHEPTDAELFMFAQVNSEHCRHKIFNASWTIDGQSKDSSLFQMIRNTEELNSTGTVSAYSDNAAVLTGHMAPRFQVTSHEGDPHQMYGVKQEEISILIKVETHNHPTAVSPYPGAATGSGGEIRDEGAVGRGSKPKAGLSGFTVSNLLIPGFVQPWEIDIGRPAHIASSFDIMMEGPLGASAFNNEFGRPALAGYFRTYCQSVPTSNGKGNETRGYHKPIMIAGGYGNVRPQFSRKTGITAGASIVVLGGPGLLIGLGGGAASSQVSGASSADLDFVSVQRDNAEMQRRCQQVIDSCVSLNERNPIQSIHDVGAGGLSNALPELVHDSDLGATFEIRDVLVADTSMSPMEIWCNESQERYVLAISPHHVDMFKNIAIRERCPYSIVGTATQEDQLVVTDRLFKQEVIRLKMSTLFGKPPKMSRKDTTKIVSPPQFDCSLSQFAPSSSSISDIIDIAVNRVLRLPCVASKSFLITIGDRSITGQVARDQMVGPYQVPVADVAVTLSTYGFDGKTGEAMAMGERTPVALLSPAASARMAVAESLLNLSASRLCGDLTRIKLSANWMCAASEEGEGAALYEAVEAIGMGLCPALGIGIPVGKDSMSMSMKWQAGAERRSVTAPLSLIVTAFAPVQDVSMTWTPQLRKSVGEPSILVLCDLAKGKTRLGASALTQVFQQLGSEAPDVEDASLLRAFINGCQIIRVTHPELVLAYHDRSDGGLFTTVAEMCFAGRAGVRVSLQPSEEPISTLFNEELGAVFQIRESHLDNLKATFDLPIDCFRVIGRVLEDDESVTVYQGDGLIFASSRGELQKTWAETSYKMQSLRDDQKCADSEYSLITSDDKDLALFYDLTFSPRESQFFSTRPKVAVLREQGVNGQLEMAFAFMAAGFDTIDVHMSDILSSRTSLAQFAGLVACGGFSYGDVLGAGKGWANSVLLNPIARKEFKEFIARDGTFLLGVCNGCQFLSHLREIIPIEQGADSWPHFQPNLSGRFEGRTTMVEIVDSESTRKSPFLGEMIGSKLPIAVAHGEGRASFSSPEQQKSFLAAGAVSLKYLADAEVYPINPNGSTGGIAGVQSKDGRVLALMPHPERNVDLRSCSWYPYQMIRESGWNAKEVGGPWFRMFQTARRWCA